MWDLLVSYGWIVMAGDATDDKFRQLLSESDYALLMTERRKE